jgi:hypothetical protein
MDGRFSATLRAEGGTHRPCADCRDRSQATQGEGYAPKLVEGSFCELLLYGVLRSSFSGNSRKFALKEFCELRLLGILGNSDAASKGIHGAAEKEPGCVIT